MCSLDDFSVDFKAAFCTISIRMNVTRQNNENVKKNECI